MAGEARGGRVNVREEAKKLISHQLKVGGLHDGETVYVKLAMDGTNITKKEVATAVTITMSYESRALSSGTISIVMTRVVTK